MAINPTPSHDDKMTDELADDAKTAVQKLRDQADAVVQKLQPQLAAVTTYARDEPTKAVLISAATGAVLMALITLLVRSDNRPSGRARSGARSVMGSIRDAAIDLADRAHGAASDAIDRAHERSTEAVDRAHERGTEAVDRAARRSAGTVDRAAKRGSEAAGSAERISDSLVDAWEGVRDRAAPVVDKLRPQIDAAASYARDEPAKTALGIAVAGAALLGLLSLLRSSEED